MTVMTKCKTSFLNDQFLGTYPQTKNTVASLTPSFFSRTLTSHCCVFFPDGVFPDADDDKPAMGMRSKYLILIFFMYFGLLL